MPAEQNYGLTATLDTTYEAALEQVTAALKEEGFGILTEIDVQSTLKKKLDVDTPRYVILGACNPKLAYQALQHEPEIGLLLPCNVIVRESDQPGKTEVGILDPQLMVKLTRNEALDALSCDARERLERVIAALKGSGSGVN